MNIYLMTDTGWKYFKDVPKEELEKRNIVIGAEASIGEGASIDEWARIGEVARIGARVSIGAQGTFLIIQNLGSRNAPMTAYKHKDSIMIGTGCYLGDIKDFEKRVKETHGDNKHGQSYVAALEYVRKVLK